jgi:hypothetical protein
MVLAVMDDENEEENLEDPTSPWAADAITIHNLWVELLGAGFPEYHATYLAGVFLRAMVQAGKPS